MQPFLTTVPLEFVAIDIFGQFLTKERQNQFLFVITDRIFKLVKTVSLINILVSEIAKSFVVSCVLIYELLQWLL